MTESELYQSTLKKMFSRLGLLCIRIESSKIPDTFIAKNGRVLWAELKCINRKQRVIKPAWRIGQLAWMKRYTEYNYGYVCLILYYCGEVYFLPPQKEYKKEELICQKEQFLGLILNQK